MHPRILTFLGMGLLSALTIVPVAAQAPRIQEGLGEKIGRKIDAGLSELGSELRQSWQDVRQQVSRFGLRGRVYARLHWDKRLQGANLDVDARDSQTVVLRGTVLDAAAKQKAVELARETEGIDQVIDELVVAPARP